MSVSAMIYVQVPQTTTVSDWRRWREDFCNEFPDFARHSETLMPDFKCMDAPRIFIDNQWLSIWDVFPSNVFLEIYYGAREYYGSGYERGYLPNFIDYAKWLKINIPESHVWYGNDSGDTAGIFNTSARDLFLNYWDRFKYSPYDAPKEEKYKWKNDQDEWEKSWATETQQMIQEIKEQYGIQRL